MDVSIVIACLNEAGHLEESVGQIERTLDQTRYSYELIFVDDGSRDNTREIIQKLCSGRKNAKFQFHPENVGRGGSVSDGMRMASGTYVGFLDIDLEIHCRYLPAFLEALDGGADVTCAFRIYRVEARWSVLLRHVLSLGYRWLMQSRLRLPLRDTEAGFKFFRRETILPVLARCRNTGWFWDTEIMARSHAAGLVIREIPVLFLRRDDKKTTVRLWHDTIEYYRALNHFRKEPR